MITVWKKDKGNIQMRLVSIASGSSGNCIYVGSEHSHILVDAGISGRTELDDPNLEFRFCSKCNGNYEYCQDHLFTHEHVK